MKFNVITLALAATAFGALAANAQTVIIEERRPAVIVEERAPVVIQQEAPASSVTVQERGGFLGTEKKTITRETTGSGDCESKTVHKEDLTGSKTVSKTRCD